MLEGQRDRDHQQHETLDAGLSREREVEHDLQVYRAYERAEARRLERRSYVERVVVEAAVV